MSWQHRHEVLYGKGGGGSGAVDDVRPTKLPLI
jgi:hypothetical protein